MCTDTEKTAGLTSIESGAMVVLFVAFFVSVGVTLLLVRRAKSHAHRFFDHVLSGPQKFHSEPEGFSGATEQRARKASGLGENRSYSGLWRVFATTNGRLWA